jgi:broad specificity phosphatase PhoE
VLLDWRLRECDYGELNGRPAGAVSAVRARHLDEPFPGGESYRDVVRRTQSFLAELVRGWDGVRVLVIAHSANRWALEHLLSGVPLEELVGAPFEWQPGWEYLLAAR